MAAITFLFCCLLPMLTIIQQGKAASCSSVCPDVPASAIDMPPCTISKVAYASKKSGWWPFRRTRVYSYRGTAPSCCQGFEFRGNWCVRIIVSTTPPPTTTPPPGICGCPSLLIAAAAKPPGEKRSKDTPFCTAKASVHDSGNGRAYNAITDVARKWPDAVIPYSINGFANSETSVIVNAISKLNAQTCLQLVPRTNQADYVQVIKETGCWSLIGRQGGIQLLSLEAPACLEPGIIMHEFLHAAGFYHEHNRVDRDSFVCINYDNIQLTSDILRQFSVKSSDVLNTPYTFGSIMHYSSYAFAKDDNIPTIFPRSCQLKDLNAMKGKELDRLHSVDILRVQRLYDGMGNC